MIDETENPMLGRVFEVVGIAGAKGDPVDSLTWMLEILNSYILSQLKF